MRKPTKPVTKVSKRKRETGVKVGKAQARAEKARRTRSRAKAESAAPSEPVAEAFGEAELPPAGPGFPAELVSQDRSRQKAKFRELTWAQFDQLVQGLAREISSAFKADAVVGVAHGGVFVGGAVARALACEFFPVRISRRSRDKGVSETPRIHGEMPAELKGRRVLIVDDVASSGDTLELAQTLAQRVGTKEVATACLVAREGGYAPRWTALLTSELVVFPWDYEPIVERHF